MGLDYLTLARSAATLSGGESQRIRLATQIGSALTGVLYVLDEPSIGLHQRDNSKLIATLKRLRDLGNTLVVVEHDEETMREADWIVDIGPGAGVHGGELVAEGTVEDICKVERSITGQYLSGRKKISVPEKRRTFNGHYLEIIGATQNNLKKCLGQDSSGCHDLRHGYLRFRKIQSDQRNPLQTTFCGFERSPHQTRAHKDMKGLEWVDKVIGIDQSPIGRTPRSNPATYTGVFSDIRNVFAQTQDAKMRGYNPGRFSFNVKGGRCEACEGDGILKIEMHFLPDIYVPCEVCKGARYNRETLEVKYKGKTIADVLDMTVEEACTFFENIPRIHRKIQTLVDVGLGYISKWGKAPRLCPAVRHQRVKLALELAKRETGQTVYILDEPTTGLHVCGRAQACKSSRQAGGCRGTVIIIEHNLDIIKRADHIIDLGPEGGSAGGEIVAQGTPEEVAQNPRRLPGST